VTIARPALVALAGVAAMAGCSGDEPAPDGKARRPTPLTVAGVELHPIPEAVRQVCRATQRRSRTTVLCPTRLPRPVQDFAGTTALPPDVLTAFSLDRHGVDFSYSAESGRPRLDRPERFFHLQVTEQEQELPPGTRPDGLGGKPGLLAKATSLGYSSETYFANHWRFFWSEDDADYAATLHSFGPRTRPLLDWLIGDLRPARSLPPPSGDRPGVKTIDVPVSGPVSIALHDRQVWVAGQGDRSVSASWIARLDESTGWDVGERIRVTSGGPSALLADAGGVWIAHLGIGLQLIGAGSTQPIGGFDRPLKTVGLAQAAGSLWVVELGDPPAGRNRGWVVEPDRRRRVAVGRAPAAIATGAGDLWVTNNVDGTVTRVDPRAGRVVATIPVGRGPVGVSASHGAVWVANAEEDTVSRIDARSERVVATIPVGRDPRAIAAGEGAIWVTNSLNDSVTRIDPATNRVAETIPVGAGPTAVAVGGGAVWVANNHDGTVTRISR
jgi:YVTN family beta-propeller protein